MHNEILSAKQVEVLPLVHRFARRFYLVGGTAIALHLGHRRSIDFDLFSSTAFANLDLLRKIRHARRYFQILVNKKGELTGLIGDVKLTFYHYPYPIECDTRFEDVIKLPSLLTLAAMKAFALGQRAKWKDYVDLYFILQRHPDGVQEVTRQAEKLFQDQFNEKLFRQQLTYFDDIDYREEVIYLPGFETDPATIRQALTDFALAK